MRARADALLGLLVFSATVAYLATLPATLGRADESFFLYQAKRIRDGQVMYRDFFQFAAPGAWYTMAFLFRLFGTTNGTARLATAVLHGATGVVLSATCRTLGVRRALALTVPLAYLALCQSAWPIASPHWFATFFVVLLLLAAVRAGHPVSPRAAFGLGALLGLLTLVHQHKGVVMGAGVATLLAANHAIGRRYGVRTPGLGRQLAALAAGAVAVVGPVAALFVAAVGADRRVQELCGCPMHDYRTGVQRGPWASAWFLSQSYAEYTWLPALRYTPLAFVPAALRTAVDVLRGTARRETSALVAMI